jgi:hypothetical protein
MRKSCFSVVALVSLAAACAPIAPKAGMADRDPLRRAVVEDVAEGMSHVFDAPGTVLVRSRPSAGAFDTALMAALRGKGFQVSVTPGRGESFDCRVDPLEGTMYRVTVIVGKTELSRLWVLDGANAYSGGAWTRRE